MIGFILQSDRRIGTGSMILMGDKITTKASASAQLRSQLQIPLAFSQLMPTFKPHCQETDSLNYVGKFERSYTTNCNSFALARESLGLMRVLIRLHRAYSTIAVLASHNMMRYSISDASNSPNFVADEVSLHFMQCDPPPSQENFRTN